ncbi:MAG TPA: metal ABC transporter substrate-binding protein [Thermoclostridium sp.]|nr:metal ABC transporter substrate-binding protein [Thermoclostridium sp.]
MQIMSKKNPMKQNYFLYKRSKPTHTRGDEHFVKKRSSLLIAITFIALFTASMLLSSCSANNTNSTNHEDGKVTAYTSFFTMYDFTSKIGGDKVNIINMVPSGMEPHHWEPSPRDVAGLSHADLFIYNGAGMEGWAEKVIGSISNGDLIAVEASKNIAIQQSQHTHESGENDTEADKGHSHNDHNHDYDPHVWLDPMNAKIQMNAIKEALIGIDAENTEYYQQNYEFYAKKLDALDEQYKEAVATFSKKEIVVSHKAYGYLCTAYGLTQIALEGIASESEPTPAKMAEIVDFIRDNDVNVIFFDGLSSSKVADAVARETGASVAVLCPIEGVSQEDIKEGKDYFSIMEDNLEALSAALK